VSSLFDKNRFLTLVLLEWLLIVAGIGLYYLFPFVSFFFNDFGDFGFTNNVEERFLRLVVFAGVYILLVPLIFYFKTLKGNISKTFRVISEIKKGSFDKQIFLGYILKFIFIPMMYFGVIEYTLLFWDTFIYLTLEGFPEGFSILKNFNQLIFPMFINLTLAIAVAVYLFGYCVEHEKLGSKIKSVDSTWFGWIVTIICYPPIFAVVFYIIPKGDQELAFFKNEEITAIVRAFLMCVILFKTWVIFTLGTKSSNLTNRGIVSNGPYKWIRHPHYLAKMIVWWICLIPTALLHPWVIGGMIFWSTIYVLRALTEELHLKKDPDYQVYMRHVKWRFIPGVY
jgi:protein-S-isoprenylcysteine O-methyltransferase Ste14